MVGFLLVNIILFVRILYIFIRIIQGFMFQPPDKFLEAVCQMRDLVVVFLIYMDHSWFSPGAAGPVVQKDHIMPSAGTVTDSHTNSRILPLINHKLAAQFSAEGAALFPSDTENAGDGHMILCPAGRFIAWIAGVPWYSAVMLLHQPDVGGRQLVAQLILHAGNQLIRRRFTDIFF